MKNCVCIDFGANDILVYDSFKKEAVEVPSVVAIDKFSGKILATGDEAKILCGRIPGSSVLLYPFRHGVDYESEYFFPIISETLKKLKIKGRSKTRAIFVCHELPDDVQRELIEKNLRKCDFRDVKIMDKAVLTSIGTGCDPFGNDIDIIFDIGSSAARVSIITRGKNVMSGKCRAGGDLFDASIAAYIAQTYGITIKQDTARRIKNNIVSVWPSKNVLIDTADGVNISDGLPNGVSVTSKELLSAIHAPVSMLGEMLNGIIKSFTESEYYSDIFKDCNGSFDEIFKRGIILSGNGSLMGGFEEFVGNITFFPVHTLDEPGQSVVYGIEEIVKYSEKSIAELFI